jgi:hypothetical protein
MLPNDALRPRRLPPPVWSLSSGSAMPHPRKVKILRSFLARFWPDATAKEGDPRLVAVTNLKA